MTEQTFKPWWIYKGTGKPHNGIQQLPVAPPWRRFTGIPHNEYETNDDEIATGRRRPFQAGKEKTEIDLVNTALILRRPLLVTGPPGTGKSSLAHSVAHELQLGKVLVWPITSRSTLQDALYRYDAIGRLQEANLKKQGDTPPEIGRYVRLGTLGTALLPRKVPRVLLIDEIDKSDIDLPNDLLNIFEEGEFEIPELARLPEEQQDVAILPHDSHHPIPVQRGHIRCQAFPFVVLTSNGERELPAAFLRRCIRLDIKPPAPETLAGIVATHFGSILSDEMVVPEENRSVVDEKLKELRALFLNRRDKGQLATDQLLNAIHLAISLAQQETDLSSDDGDLKRLLPHIWRYLDEL